MKIIEFRASNFKRLSAVAIKPDGSLVTVAGKNAAGKSSVLDAIWAALGGKSVIDQKPIRIGEDAASVMLDLGEYRVTRAFKTRDSGETFTTTLTIDKPDGSPVREPQKLLDSLVGDLTLDPLAFESASPTERFTMIRSLLPGIDFDQHDLARKQDYEARTEFNRQAKDAYNRAVAIVADMSVGDVLIDAKTIYAEMDAVTAHNSEIAQRKHRREVAARDVEAHRREARRLGDEAEELRERADALDAAASAAVATADGMQKRLDDAEPLPDPKDPADLRRRLEDAQQHNSMVERRQSRLALLAESRRAEEAAGTLTEAMKTRDEALAQAIAMADFPVKDIAFDGRMVLLGGVPFEQASDAQRLKASVEIAMAANPSIRVIRVRDGSKLDKDNLALLGKIAEERGFQVWVERVGDEAATVVIEDGHVRGQSAETIVAEDVETVKSRRRAAMRKVIEAGGDDGNAA